MSQPLPLSEKFDAVSGLLANIVAGAMCEAQAASF